MATSSGSEPPPGAPGRSILSPNFRNGTLEWMRLAEAASSATT